MFQVNTDLEDEVDNHFYQTFGMKKLEEGHMVSYCRWEIKHIITVQHPQSVHHTNGMVGSWTDWDLSDFGKHQAGLIAEKLSKELNGRSVKLFSSDLKRAVQPARILGDKLSVQPILRTELRERNLESCCGQSVTWLKENLECEEKTVDDKLFSDAESRREVWQRLFPFYETVMLSEDEWTIIVSHGDLLSIWNAMFMKLPVESLNNCQLFGCSEVFLIYLKKWWQSCGEKT